MLRSLFSDLAVKVSLTRPPEEKPLRKHLPIHPLKTRLDAFKFKRRLYHNDRAQENAPFLRLILRCFILRLILRCFILLLNETLAIVVTHHSSRPVRTILMIDYNACYHADIFAVISQRIHRYLGSVIFAFKTTLTTTLNHITYINTFGQGFKKDAVRNRAA